MNNKKIVEEQLLRARHTSVSLSDAEKREIFWQVMAGATPVPQPPRKRPWWQIAAPLSAIGAAVVVTVLILNPPSEQPIQVASGEQGVPAQPQPAPTPQPTPSPEPTHEQPSSLLGYVYSDTPAEAPRLNGRVLVGRIYGFGGGGPQDEHKEITFSTQFSDTIPQARQYAYGLSETQMQGVARILGEEVAKYNNGAETLVSTLKKKPFRTDCIERSRDDTLTEPCVVVTSAGFVNVQYPPGEGISVDQAKRIMGEILAVSSDEIAQTPVEESEMEKKISNWSFIALHVPHTVALDLPYDLPVWYVGTDGGEAISLIGNAFAIDTENATPLELVSEQEAVARLEQNLTTIDGPSYTFHLGAELWTDNGVLEGEIVYEITSVKLIYRQFLSHKGKNTLMPLYEFTGVERNNDHPVTFHVDATKKGKMNEQYTLLGDV